MSGHLRHRHELPPLRRGYEASRLEVQQTIAAYECVLPVIRRTFKTHQGTPFTHRPRTALAGTRRANGGRHQ
jgi:hypothetical protein